MLSINNIVKDYKNTKTCKQFIKYNKKRNCSNKKSLVNCKIISGGANTPIINRIKYKAIYDFVARENSELSFLKDDIITILKKDTDIDTNQWWTAININGNNDKKGQVPSNYIEIYN